VSIMISELTNEVRVGTSPTRFVIITSPGLTEFDISTPTTAIAIFFEAGFPGEALVDWIRMEPKV